MLDLVNKLPRGLSNADGKLTLRRAVNHHLGLDKPLETKTVDGKIVMKPIERRDYTNQELMDAVIAWSKSSPQANCISTYM